MYRYLPLAIGAIALGACSSATSQSSASLTPADVLDMGIDMFGVVPDIPHRQYLGESGALGVNQTPTVYRWGGMYEDVRYRLAGALTRISISGHYDIRLTVDWQLYDTDTESLVFAGSSNGFARGQNLGLTGMQPNAMLDSFQDCLGNLLGADAFAAAIAAEDVP
ncbi:MAG: hypothetical protein KJO06_08420, partial [Gemmatimonadetes bacterium]|nr:hypothetical protein [Gemmatimonadota bacterium]